MNSITILGYIHKEPEQVGENGCYGIVKSRTIKKNKDDKYIYIYFLFQAYRHSADYCLKNVKKGDEVLIIGEIIPSFKDEKDKILEVKSIKKFENTPTKFPNEEKPAPKGITKESFMNPNKIEDFDDLPF